MTVFIEMIVFELFIHLFSQKHHLRLEKWRYSHQSVGARHVAFTNQIALATICFHWLWFRISPVARCIDVLKGENETIFKAVAVFLLSGRQP